MLGFGFGPKEIVHRLQLERDVERSKAELLVQVSLLQREMLAPVLNRPDLISLYVNIPFCPSRCAYCSFTTRTSAQYNEAERGRHMTGLLREIENLSDTMRSLDLKLCTVYVGGGTPTTLSPLQLRELLNTINSLPRWQDTIEITVEAGRPDTITREKLAELPSLTRISINPQTMNDATLQRIGRLHTVSEVRESFALAQEMGLSNINADLIIGLPEEGAAGVRQSLAEVLALGPSSVTAHMFSPKRTSRFTEGEDWIPMQPEEAERASHNCRETLLAHGMRPYYLYRQRGILAGLENMGWSHPGKECLYNILFIGETQAIVGVGAGATSIFPLKDAEWKRHLNPKELKMYLNRLDKSMEDKRTLLEKWRGQV
ncbi:MAG: Coproporphyrinogen III oxidase and related Fe-S oxidoreductase [Bacillota bacterium]|nr:MAG: Coproporphyrinogen III oxidase and related Fe-S oxidoreductase [Bacillota bacterium]